MQIDTTLLADQSALALATVLMVGALLLAFVPTMPGAILLWFIGVGYGFLTQFQRVTPAAAVSLTLLLLMNVTNDIWLPILGIRTRGLTCLSAIGAFIGAIVGSFVIPIFIVGTIVGSILGALVVDLIRFGDLHKGFQAGEAAFKQYLLSYIVQVVTSVAMFGVYIASLLTTG